MPEVLVETWRSENAPTMGIELTFHVISPELVPIQIPPRFELQAVIGIIKQVVVL